MKKKQIPDIIVSRLPVYLRGFGICRRRTGKPPLPRSLVSRLVFCSADLRRIFRNLGNLASKVPAYAIAFLVDKLREILRVEHVWDVALVGMGDMGHALARYPGFGDQGFRV